MEGCCSGGICETINSKIILFNLDCYYLNWRNPMKTGVIVATINLFFFLMTVSNLNLFVILTYLFLFYVVSGIVVTQLMGKPEKEYK